jgi:NhaP-type Na+/H+ or K+/H+ antiporter
MIDSTVALFASIFVVSSLCQWLAWRVKLPAIIFLLLTGLLAGPTFKLFNPDQFLGDLLFPVVSLSVAVILFEGSLTLKFREIKGMHLVVRNMCSFGMFITWIITTVATRLATGICWELCFLFGAISVVTGPTVIAPMLRTVRPTASISSILRWEGIVIDPIGASLAVLVYEFIISGGGQDAIGHTLISFGNIVLVGFVIGAAGGYGFGQIIRHHWLPEYLHNVSALALVFGTFALSNLLQPESGLVTVTVLGMWLANMPDVDMEEILDFKESLSILLISLLFIILAARLDFDSFKQLGWSALYIFLAIQFLARPLNIMLSAIGSSLSWPERHMLAWIAPRGIVAAAVSALFALQLEQAGFKDAALLVPLTFLVIIGTVLLQSATARPIALWLGVAEPEPRGFLIIGANPVARAIGKSLTENGFRVRLADSSWEKISKARMDGLPTYFGNAISEHADRHLDMVGLGRLLALSSRESLNVNAIMHYRIDLGQENIYSLQTRADNEKSEKMQVNAKNRGQRLFGANVTFHKLREMLEQGGEVHTTKMTETFTFDKFIEQQFEGTIPLFAIDRKDNIRIFTAGNNLSPLPGWQIISMMPPEFCLTTGPINGEGLTATERI